MAGAMPRPRRQRPPGRQSTDVIRSLRANRRTVLTTKAERREEIKLKLEYAKLAISVVGVGALFFAALQWFAANQVAQETVYQRMASTWTDHLRILVEKPELRPYFQENKELVADDHERQEVLAYADLRLDVMDAILSYGHERWS